MLTVQSISKSYRGIPAVQDVSFELRGGQILGFLGPNGAGKSTTVKMVIGLLQPSSGQILFEERRIDENLPRFRSQLGYVPEEAQLYTHLSGLEYLLLIGRLRNLPERLIKARACRLLDLLGLASWHDSPIGLYSKGMKQRVLIAAALLHNPKLLVFDEPLSGLDVTSARLFRDLLTALAADGRAILYISHVLEVVERVCDRVIVLAEGRVKADAAPSELGRMMQLPDLQAVFAELIRQQDTQAAARSIVEALHADLA
jgi:ABC-2 type transport system ATP-binding protein